MLSETEKQTYIRKGGVRCPYCSSYNIEAGQLNMEESGIYQDVECKSCGKSWMDEYTLTAILEQE